MKRFPCLCCAGLLLLSLNCTSLSAEGSPQVFSAEQVMKALSRAYPDRIGPAVKRSLPDGSGSDWAVQVYGRWFYYAAGRLLPAEELAKAADYDPQPFYSYPAELPPWREPTPREDKLMAAFAERQEKNPPKRSRAFFDDLWRAHSEEESYLRVKTIHIFGFKTLIHYSILDEVALVEQKINDIAMRNADVADWINGLKQVDSWNWRNIAATESRSYHAYGAAIDFIPKKSRGLAMYWQWTAEYAPRWWAVPYSKRLNPPDAVIRAFESCGFIWGGKWRNYDTMHFEYRPEILILSGIPMDKWR